MLIKVDKKIKYLVQSIAVSALLYYYADSFSEGVNVTAIILIIGVAVLGTFIVQYPNISIRNLLINILMPLHLVAGSILSLIYFPNLGLPVKILFISFVGLGFYVVCLISNVFMVVQERSELIPLYRVAVTWGQIMMIIVAIPFFAAVYKLPINSIIQNLITSFSAFLFSIYLVRVLMYDKETKKVGGVEYILFSLIISFMVFSGGISASFIPTESFLRALFTSTVMMLGLSYLYSHLKNSVTKKMLVQYFLISVLFFLLLFIFKP